MNTKSIRFILGWILNIEALLMLLPVATAVFYREEEGIAYALVMAVCAAVGALMTYKKPNNPSFYAKEGFVCTALGWILMSAFGCVPFMLTGEIPSFVDAMFEMVSGFTTTGASVVLNVEELSHCTNMWRCFSHWIGGMGVLVLTLALVPQLSERTSHLVKAESPGPTLSKIVPKMGDTAKIFYIIYLILTILEFIVLMIAGMNPYDAAIHAMGTAGTGGFSNYAASVGAFASPVIDIAITVFMVMFGINFALYYCAITGNWRGIVKSEELRWYLGIFLTVTTAITVVILPQYGTVGNALRYASFQVASIMSTTGYATADFSLWPVAARMLIFMLMFIGACAGSTAGGMKICRIAMLWKQGVRSVRHTFQPRKVQVVRFEGKGVDDTLLRETASFAFVYIAMILIGAVLIAFEGKYDIETNLSAALTCVSNVGPGFNAVGPAGNFAGYGSFAKVVLSLLMLAGRLELYPMLALLYPALWRKQ